MAAEIFSHWRLLHILVAHEPEEREEEEEDCARGHITIDGGRYP